MGLTSGLRSARKNKQVALVAGRRLQQPSSRSRTKATRAAELESEIQAVLPPPPHAVQPAFKGAPDLLVPQFPLVQSAVFTRNPSIQQTLESS